MNKRLLTGQTRTISSSFAVREDNGERRLEGYFSVFGPVYELWAGATESIAPTAFAGETDGDVRALVDHLTHLVLGRTTAGTLTLRVDERGLWGSVLINPADQDAMNLYARVQRGDVTQASFGFDILDEDEEVRDDGTVHWTITKVNPLYEVSPCVFPAYEQTSIESRGRESAAIKRRAIESRKARLLATLRRENKEDGTESPAPEKED